MADENQTESTTQQPKFLLVRIKPYNPRAGCVVRSYTYKGTRFREEAGWYRVPLKLASELRELLQDENDPLSQEVFDVLSEEAALQIEEREQQRRERATAARPNLAPELRRTDPRRNVLNAGTTGTVTTSDLLPAPNDEVAPNGYPPPRVYPMPQPTGTLNRANFTDAPVVEDQVTDELMDEYAQAGADDKSLRVASANIERDQQGVAPLVVDGQGGLDEEPNLPEGEESEDGELAAPPTTGRRRKR
jgi:hypothetical protein